MTPIATLGKIKVSENGIIANVKLDDTFRNKLLLEFFRIEDRLVNLEFKYATNIITIKEFKLIGNIETAKLLEAAQISINKEIISLRKTLKKLSKL